ncbi:MAG: sigma-E factor negative regulatory protein [Giesbergeria sp.]|jgi:sigma-E factor negative regulatory protein RseA|nr:sigma-E factor negative regulatory protein [Giesbergeria sp.]
MNDDLKQREQLSALADGQLDGEEWAQALQFAEQDEGRETWQMYHLVGDALRSADLARASQGSDFLARLHQKMAQEPLPVRMPSALAVQPASLQAPPVQAANDSLFRWKMVAGFASLAAVAAIGWNALGHVRGDSASGPQLAAAPATAPVQAVATSNPDAQVMLRDPRLDELLAAHKQYSGTTALQMPAGFLRNANFDSPSR